MLAAPYVVLVGLERMAQVERLLALIQDLFHPPQAVMLADAGAPAVLAPAPAAIMLADAGAPAVLAWFFWRPLIGTF